MKRINADRACGSRGNIYVQVVLLVAVLPQTAQRGGAGLDVARCQHHCAQEALLVLVHQLTTPGSAKVSARMAVLVLPHTCRFLAGSRGCSRFSISSSTHVVCRRWPLFILPSPDHPPHLTMMSGNLGQSPPEIRLPSPDHHNTYMQHRLPCAMR